MINAQQKRALYALYCLSRDNRHISATTLAKVLSLTPTQAARALVALERAGLVDASRARLTMLGLAAAVQAGAESGGPRLRLSAAPPRDAAAASKQPLAAAPERAVAASERPACNAASSPPVWMGNASPASH